MTTETITTNTIDALDQYGINFDVRKQALHLECGTKVKNLNAMVRSDTGEALKGVSVSDTYEVVQTRSFADIIERVTGAFNAEFVTGGSFKGGRLVYLQCKLPETIRVLDSDDVIDQNLTFINSFDGSSKFMILPTMLRVFCANQMAALTKEAKERGLRFSHTRSVRQRIKQADEAILAAMNAYRTSAEKIDLLASTPFTDSQFKAANHKLFGVELGAPEVATRTARSMDKTRELFTEGLGLDQWRGTAWAAFNAMTEFSDHHRALRSTTDRVENKLLGSGALFKARALNAVESVMTA